MKILSRNVSKSSWVWMHDEGEIGRRMMDFLGLDDLHVTIQLYLLIFILTNYNHTHVKNLSHKCILVKIRLREGLINHK